MSEQRLDGHVDTRPSTFTPPNTPASSDTAALGDTRRRILGLITEHGPLTAAQIAEELEFTSAGVRRHLLALADDGLIESTEQTAQQRGRGRPARHYVVTQAGRQDMPSAYDRIAREALDYLTEQLGPGAVDGFARARAQGLADQLQARVDAAGPQPADRAVALAEALTEAGFAATARHLNSESVPAVGVQLCQGHCPVHNVAAEYPSLCDAESEAFADLLGVHVQRLSTLAGGGHVCTTFVPVPKVPPRTSGSPHEPHHDLHRDLHDGIHNDLHDLPAHGTRRSRALNNERTPR